MAMKWTLGNSAYIVGLLLVAIVALMGSSVFGGIAIAVPAIIFGVAAVVAVTNISKAEGQKFLLLTIAQGIVGTAAISSTFTNLGLKVVENLVMGIGQFFVSIALVGVLVYAHNTYSKK
jgi:hypothetical protein